MKQLLEQIRQKAIAEIEAADETEALRIQYLGKKGELTAVLRGMGKVSPEQRSRKRLKRKQKKNRKRTSKRSSFPKSLTSPFPVLPPLSAIAIPSHRPKSSSVRSSSVWVSPSRKVLK